MKILYLIEIENSNNKGDNTKGTPVKYNASETIETNNAIIEFENMKSGLVEMLGWYKNQRGKENIIDIKYPLYLLIETS